MTEKETAYWRLKAQESDLVQWCPECKKSYWEHYDQCPHTNHPRQG